MTMIPFAHLRCHSAFSLSEGASKAEKLVAAAKANGTVALALTDKDNLFGAMNFSQAAAAAGVQPIVGIQMHVEWAKGRRGNVLLLAKTAKGYENICALLRSTSQRDPATMTLGYSVDFAELGERSEDIILLTGGGANGLLPQMVAEAPELAAETFQWLLHVFGDRLCVEICRDRKPDAAQAAVEDALIELAYGSQGAVQCMDGTEATGAPLVATSDVWYASKDRNDAWHLLKAVVSGQSVTMDGNKILGVGESLNHLRSPQEMEELFSDLPEAYANASAVARRCAFMVPKRPSILPAFPCAAGRTEAQELREQSRVGLEARLAKAGKLGDAGREYRSRLEYELGVIEKMGFPGYFLIVSDFIQWAKDHDIPVGPGRGSGAGSIVAWALTITDIDPLEFGLLFERFLNPERVSMPDFDIDFCPERREEVRDYVIQKYGADRVALIATFTVIRGKTALSDMQKVLDHQQYRRVSFGEAKELTKLIPKREEEAQPMGLDEAFEKAPQFKKAVEASPKYYNLYMQARQVEGMYRGSSAHAAGVVIGDRPLDQLVPLSHSHRFGMSVAGFDMKGVESAGLVKFDFLGLTTLTVLKLALEYVKECRGIDVDLATIPRDDAEVYRRLADGQGTGVFQFESSGMRKSLRQVVPTCLEDLIAIVALFRPGPMANIEDYALRKAGEQEFSYPGGAERTERYLGETYGIMVYQEQVMQVAQVIAGYSLAGADLLRRAMGKKDAAEMARQKDIFISGSVAGNVRLTVEGGVTFKVHRRLALPVADGGARQTAEELEASGTAPNLDGFQPEGGAAMPPPGARVLRTEVLDDGLTAHDAEKLFNDIDKFSNYGFNKSHAAAYAWVSYQTAWMKTHYPAEYLSALMTCYRDKTIKVALIKDELEALGIPLLMPDVNASHAYFRPEPNDKAPGGFAVRFGLAALKKISEAGADLSGERAARGPFRGLQDFHNRVGKRFDKAKLEVLAASGAFDCFKVTRRAASDSMAWLAARKDTAPAGQDDFLGGVMAVPVPKDRLALPEWGNVAEREFAAIGFYVSNHPIDLYLDRIVAAGVRRRVSFQDRMNSTGRTHLHDRRLCVMVDKVEMKVSANKRPYLSLVVSERSDTYFVQFFAGPDRQDLAEAQVILEAAKKARKPVAMLCSLSIEGSERTAKVFAQAVWDIHTFLANVRGDFVIDIDPALEAEANPAPLAALETGGGIPLAVALATLDPASPEGEAARSQASEALKPAILNRLREALACVGDEGTHRNIRVCCADGSSVSLGRHVVDDLVENLIRQERSVTGLREVMQSSMSPSRPAYEEEEDEDPFAYAHAGPSDDEDDGDVVEMETSVRQVLVPA